MGACISIAVTAQTYPNRPIKLIVPFAPGGGSDIIARIIAPRLGDAVGQQVVIDNKPGAGTIIGAEIAAKAAPDGYTLFVGITGTLAINPSLYQKLPYDPLRDFSPIILVATGPNILVVHPSLPVKTVRELIALAKSKPGKLSYASAGTGGAPHLAGELFKSTAGVDIVHVPYRGAAPATMDLVAGQVEIMFAGMGAALPFIKAGRLKALAVAGAKRSPVMPELPTIGESLSGFEASTWFGILSSAGTAKDIVQRLNAEIARVVKREDAKAQLLSQGYEPLTSTPEEFASYIKTELAKWSKVVRTSGARAE
jgi:tripartite-type tricarboxylate transporter receptor subunit TctC